eukprot:575445-Hanusia_phi.AAC.2
MRTPPVSPTTAPMISTSASISEVCRLVMTMRRREGGGEGGRARGTSEGCRRERPRKILTRRQTPTRVAGGVEDEGRRVRGRRGKGSEGRG